MTKQGLEKILTVQHELVNHDWNVRFKQLLLYYPEAQICWGRTLLTNNFSLLFYQPQTDRLLGTQTHRQKETETQTYTQTLRQDTQTLRHTSIKTLRHTKTKTHIHNNTKTKIHTGIQTGHTETKTQTHEYTDIKTQTQPILAVAGDYHSTIFDITSYTGIITNICHSPNEWDLPLCLPEYYN